MVKKEKKRKRERKRNFIRKLTLDASDRKLLFGKQIKDISKQISQEGHA